MICSLLHLESQEELVSQSEYMYLFVVECFTDVSVLLTYL